MTERKIWIYIVVKEAKEGKEKEGEGSRGPRKEEARKAGGKQGKADARLKSENVKEDLSFGGVLGMSSSILFKRQPSHKYLMVVIKDKKTRWPKLLSNTTSIQ